MALSVKSKIRLGTFFLFFLLILISGAGIFFFNQLKNNAQNVREDNYRSLLYSHVMLNSLDSMSYDRVRFSNAFGSALAAEEGDITEPGEREAAANVRAGFEQLNKGDTSRSVQNDVRKNIQRILAVNMLAINRKENFAKRTTEDAFTFIILTAVIVLIIAFTFLFNFPGIVVGPISELTTAIKQIGEKKYGHRVHIRSQDEFGQLANAFNEMAERLEYFESSNLNKLMFQKARAEAVINYLKDATIGMDANNTVLFANDQALNLLGLSAGEVVGKSADKVKAGNDLFRFLLDNESSAPFKIVVDGKENYFLKEVIDVPQGDSSSKVLVVNNITSFKELDVAKSNFIATISHELKTPLASSDFSIRLLEDQRVGQLSTEQQEIVANLKADNRRMLRILSELLNMSQAEAGKLELNAVPLSPETLVEQAIASVLNAAKEKKIGIGKELPGNLPSVLADSEKTGWVLNNLLFNAVKFGPADSSVDVRVERKENSLIFSVTDKGPGIPAEFTKKVFERYFRIPGSRSSGNGLGLAICKDFIEAQGGSIWVESSGSAGSTFRFSLPIAQSDPAPAQA